jgi:Tol biopolymer transport system component
VSLAAGSRLGPYEILAPIGAGGMGEVYRARDPRLNRDVAIKVLPADRLADEGRRQRFLREARAAATLSHPHIVTVYEVEAADGIDFLVMEYVRGKSLDSLISRGGLRLGETLRIAIAVADALAAAHLHGIIHRDLKPGNVMVGSESAVKVLDFGLAKLLSNDVDSGDPADETHTQAADLGLSSPGMVVGTAAYMSPEQATGQPVDPRSDIFSFGAMLYEMVTGQRAFAGTSTAETLSAVIRAQPKPPASVVAGVPPELERIILRCLRKDPGRRFQHIDDVKVALQEVKDESESGTVAATAMTARKRWPLVAIAVCIAVVLGLAVIRRPGSSQNRPAPIAVTPLTTVGGGQYGPQLSPNGQTVAYAWTGAADDNWDIYVKAIGQGTKPVRLTENPLPEFAPAWSPDGRQIVFARLTSNHTYGIYLIPSLGGEERKLIDVQSVTSETGYLEPRLLPRFTWSRDGQWLAYVARPTAEKPARILKLSLETLESVPVTTPPEGTTGIGDTEPELSPDGTTLAFVRAVTSDWGQEDIWLQAIAGGEPRRLTSSRYDIVNSLTWTADGSAIVFSTGFPGWGGQLRTVRTSGGEPEPVGGVGDNATHPSLRGDTAVFVQSHMPTSSMYRVANPRRAAKDVSDSDGGAVLSEGVNPAYSPDNRRIAFQSDRLGTPNIWVEAADGTHPIQLTNFKQAAGTSRWSPDGQRIVFDSNEKGSYDLWVVASEGGLPRQLTHDPADETLGTWSSDGRWIYFGSNRTGRNELWKIPANGGTEMQVTRTGGSYGIETPDGKTLYYSRFLGGVNSVRRLSLQTGEEAAIVDDGVVWANWAAGKDGIYYLVYPPGQTPRGHPIEIRFQSFDGGPPVLLYRSRTEFGAVWSMTLSPDEKWLVFSQQPLWQSQLMLIENFK